MEKLFYELISDKQVKRSLKIISILSNLKHEIPLKKLMEMLCITKKTLETDLSKIQQILPEGYQLEISEKNISLKSKKGESIDNLLIGIAKDTLTYQLLNFIFINKYENVHEYSENLHISVTALKRKIISINEILKKFECKISLYNLRMTGSEVNIRYFYYTFFLNFKKNTLQIMMKNLKKIMRFMIASLIILTN